MMKIILIGLRKESNLGDVIINDCTEYLIKKIFDQWSFLDYDLITVDMAEEDYSMIPQSDLIIFSGGGLIKYKYQKCYHYINEILTIAEREGIPTIFNAVGVEGYDDSNINCIMLKNAINKFCVKQITVRDDINLLKEKYIHNNKIYIEKVADSAVWSCEVYQVQKDPFSFKIGLGVIREGIFISNGIDIGRDQLLDLWGSIITQLEENKMDWEIFTTGWPSDRKFAVNLMSYLGREADVESKVVALPETAEEVVRNIAKYKGVIAGRLHANIVAYSLGIPSVGLIWNEKCSFWGENIGFKNRYFRYNEFNGKSMVNALAKAIEEGYHEEYRELYKNTTYHSLEKFLGNFLKEYRREG